MRRASCLVAVWCDETTQPEPFDCTGIFENSPADFQVWFERSETDLDNIELEIIDDVCSRFSELDGGG